MKKTVRIAAVLVTAATISFGSITAASASSLSPAPPTNQETTEPTPAGTEETLEELEKSVEGVTPAQVVDRTVQEEGNLLTEATTLDTGDVFTSVLDTETNDLVAYYNGEYVNQVNLNVVYNEMVANQATPGMVQPMNWRCNTIEWLAYGNTAVWGIAAALFPPSVLAAAVGGSLTGAALLAAKQACEAQYS